MLRYFRRVYGIERDINSVVESIIGDNGNRCDREGKFAVVMLDRDLKRVVSKPKLFRLIKELKPEIVAVDNIAELLKIREKLCSFEELKC